MDGEASHASTGQDNAKAVIVPSEWYENCPYSVMEAMARGRIVIASRIAGLLELIEENKTGFLFSLRNAGELADKLCCVDVIDASKACQMSEKHIVEQNSYLIQKYTTQN